MSISTTVARVAACSTLVALVALAVASVYLPDADNIGLVLLGVAVLLSFTRGASARLLMATFSGFVMLRYLASRFDTFPANNGIVNLVAAVLLFGSEIYGASIVLMGYFVSSRPLHREPEPLPDDPSLLPFVDVYIPTYSEPLSVVAPTVLGALELDYPANRLKIYVLDDGFPRARTSKPEVAQELIERAAALRALCARHGAFYLTRESNEHAKSGNLNSALGQTSGELVAILDADHIPTRDFLKNTVGFFLKDSKAALVQTPHFFTNADPVEKNLGLFNQMPAENDLFYRIIQKGLDTWNAAFFCGSAAVLRRNAVLDVNGFSADSITEDASTTVKLHQRGWRTVYYGRPMVAGLQPETFSGFLVQRIRWATGMVQILMKQNPLLIKGLTLGQRLCYSSTTLFWFFPIARIVTFFAPLLCVAFGMQIYPGGSEYFMAYTLPYVVVAVLTAERTTGRFRRIFSSELYEALQAVYMLPALVSTMLNPTKPTFKVTPKGEKTGADFLSEFRAPFYVAILLTGAGALWGVKRMIAEPATAGLMMFSVGWLVFNFFLGLGALGTVFERAQRRSRPRVDVNEAITLVDASGDIQATLIDANELGCRVRVPEGKNLTDFAVQFEGHFLPAQALPRNQHSKPNEFAALYSFATPVQERAAVSLAFGSSERWVSVWRQREASANFLKSLAGMLALCAKGATAHFAFLRSRNSRWTQLWQARAAFALGLFIVVAPAEGQSVPVPLSIVHAQDATPALKLELAPRDQLAGVRLNVVRERSAVGVGPARYVVWANGELVGQYPAQPSTSQTIRLPATAFGSGVNTVQLAFAPSDVPINRLQPDSVGIDLPKTGLTFDLAGSRPNPAVNLAQLRLAFDGRSLLPHPLTIVSSAVSNRAETLSEASTVLQSLALRSAPLMDIRLRFNVVPPRAEDSAAQVNIPKGVSPDSDVLLVGRRGSLGGLVGNQMLATAAGPALGVYPLNGGRSVALVVTGDTEEDVQLAALALASPGSGLPARSWQVFSRRDSAVPKKPLATREVALGGDNETLELAGLKFAIASAENTKLTTRFEFGSEPAKGRAQIILASSQGFPREVRRTLPDYADADVAAGAVGIQNAGTAAIIGRDDKTVLAAVEQLRGSRAWNSYVKSALRFDAASGRVAPLSAAPLSLGVLARELFANSFVYWIALGISLLLALLSFNLVLTQQTRHRLLAAH